jgi:hypothetical protein
MGMSRQIADMLGDISAEALFAMTGVQIALHIASQPMAIVRRLDYLVADKFDANPRYHRPPAGLAAG